MRWGGAFQEQESLRKFYADLIAVLEEPAFTDGEFYGLNHANEGNPAFGRTGRETVSGHWLYAFLRYDVKSGQAFLCIANFSASDSLKNVRISIPEHALGFLGRSSAESLCFEGTLGTDAAVKSTMDDDGVMLSIGDVEPFGVRYYQLK